MPGAWLEQAAAVQGSHYPSNRAPGRLQALLHFAESWALPAGLLQLEGLVRSVPRRRKRRRVLTTISQSGAPLAHNHHRSLLSRSLQTRLAAFPLQRCHCCGAFLCTARCHPEAHDHGERS